MIEKEENENDRQAGMKPLIVGIGGSGSNMIDELSEGINATVVASNTDASHLREINSDQKLLLGLKLTNGQGTGNQPRLGQSAAINNREMIHELYTDHEIVFLVTGLGGGTGTGATPVFAEIAKRKNLFTIAICTFPFVVEGTKTQNTAFKGLDILEDICDIVILLPNDNLEGLNAYSVRHAFDKIDEIVSNLVQVLTKCLENNINNPQAKPEYTIETIHDQIAGQRYSGLEHLHWELERTDKTTKFYLLPSEIPLVSA